MDRVARQFRSRLLCDFPFHLGRAPLPCSILEMVPGYLFGFQVGTVSAILGKTIGTGISLFIGRFFLKGWIQERLLKKYPTLLAFEKAVKLGGFKTVLAIRITYLPMLVKNYGLACLDIPLSMISSASFVSAIPFAMLWNIIGASAKDLTEIFEGKIGWRDVIPDEFLHYAPFGLVIAAAIVYVFYTFVQDLRSTLKQIASSNE